MNEKNEIDYSAPAPETKDFILRIDDSEVDLDQVRVKMQDLECERNHYRTQLATLRQQLAESDLDNKCVKVSNDNLRSQLTTCQEQLRQAQAELNRLKGNKTYSFELEQQLKAAREDLEIYRKILSELFEWIYNEYGIHPAAFEQDTTPYNCWQNSVNVFHHPPQVEQPRTAGETAKEKEL